MDALKTAGKKKDRLGSDLFGALDIGRIYVPGENEKIYGLVIESSYAYKGVLSGLSKIADELGVTVKYIQFSMPMPGGEKTAKGIAFIDFSNAKVSPEEGLKILESKDYVKRAKIIYPVTERIISDNCFFPLVASNERVAIFRKSVYEALFEGIRKQFGSAGEAFLYYQGFAVGTKIFDDYLKIAGEMDAEKIAKVGNAVNMTLGWGIIELVEIDTEDKKALVRIYQNFECELGKGRSNPYSQFYRGAIAGMFARFFGKEVEVEETRCIAKGDPCCEFYVKA